ncbi:MAG: exodeoxyribonuclease VII large subunit [Clostridia bacterium]
MQLNKDFYSVSEVNQLLSKKIENDLTFQLMLVVGEIVNYKKHSSGHIYFSLKDQESRLKCVMFKSQARYLTFIPENGQQILAQGKISIYEKYGEYQLYVDSLHKMGFGDLRQKYLKLKTKLAEQGYFDIEIKKALPKFPKKIAVITSKTGAVIHDIIRTIKERFPICEVILFPANVQGNTALEDILKCFNDIIKHDPDIVILGRGGGSEEDLWTFNEERLVKEIYNCSIPVITAIGHEIDITLSDLVADFSVATPTAAAITATPDISQLLRDLDYYENNIIKITTQKLNALKQNVINMERQLKAYEPNTYLDHLKESLSLKIQKLNYLVNYKITNYRNKVNFYENAINNLYVKQGRFPKVYDKEFKKEVKSIDEVALGTFLNLVFKDGILKVKSVHKEGHNNEKIND